MIDLDTIEREIHNVEARGDTTYSMCERLAWLYVVRDHLAPETKPQPTLSGSEFLDAASGVPYQTLMQVMDEHMQAVRVVQPKEYESVMAKIQSQ